MSKIMKITSGAMIQEFNEKGEFVRQYFQAEDQVEWIDYESGYEINSEDTPLAGREYHPFPGYEARYRVFDIVYDLDSKDEEFDLPNQIYLSCDKKENPSYELADEISDYTGFCVVSFQWEGIE